MQIEGYKDLRSAWNSFKKRFELQKGIDYETFIGAELKLFKTLMKNSDENTPIYEKYKTVPRLDVLYMDNFKDFGFSNTKEGMMRRFRRKRFEEETIPFIIDIFKDIYKIDYQLKVGKYYIDAYIKELNLAIECDEMNHRNYKSDDESKREKFIRTTLGCEFLRFNPNDYRFGITKIINQICKIGMQRGTFPS